MSKKIYITEEQLNQIKKQMLTEDRGSKNLSQVRRYIQQHNPNINPQQLIDSLRHDIPNIRLPRINNTDIYQFALGVTRMYLDGELQDGHIINQLNNTLKYVASNAHINEYDKNLNGLSCNDLIKRFETVITNDIEGEKTRLANNSYTKSDYEIVPINTPKEARKYGKYTSWCVTHHKDTYNSYTANGSGRFYFCLKPGFEKLKPVVGKGCPLDEYGLSMIAVSVNTDGSPNTITCRWNHDNGGNDNIMTTEELSNLIGMNFYEVFKPYTREELHAKGVILFDEVQDLLNSGKKPEEIFDEVYAFKDDYACVKLNGKGNVINRRKGELLFPNQWFDYVWGFRDDYVLVELNDRVNLINFNGELLSPNQWFDYISIFENGYAIVELNREHYYLRSDGVLCDYNTKEPLPNQTLNEQKRILLSENRESKNMSKARNLLYQQGYSQENAQKTIEAIRNDIPNARLADCKFLPGVTRMYLNSELSDGNIIMKLNKTLKYVASDTHVNEYDNNLNGLSVNELVQRFAGVQQQDADVSRAESYGKQFTRNNAYSIVRIPDAETAAKYGRYTSWCVTHDKNMYNSYTAGGTGLFYFCLKNGFEELKPVVGKGCPLDNYGLSMIAVSVTMDGELNTCTCRWNHDNGGNDNIMDKNQVEELLGVNFYEVFKPYTREELHAKGVILFDEVQDLLNSGKKPKEIFDYVSNFENGYARVKLNNKYNFINANGKLLSPNQWFDDAWNFSNGYAVVELNSKQNLINTNGELLWNKPVNQWFDYVASFRDGYAWVELNNKFNFINANGKLLSPNQWFDYAYSFRDGYAIVKLNDKYNFINRKGKLLSPNQWFDSAEYFIDGYAIVKLNSKWNLINTNGKLLSPNQWFDDVDYFIDGYAIVELTNKYNFINTNGKLLSPNQWFDDANSFENGYAWVKLNNKLNFINIKGELVWNKPVNQWFDEVGNFRDGYVLVKSNGNLYRLRSDGVLCDYNTEPLPNQELNETSKKGKKIYITEEQKNIIVENLQEQKKLANISEKLKNDILTNNTPFSYLPMNKTLNKKIIEGMLLNGYETAVKEFSDDITSIPTEQVAEKLGKLIRICQKKEEKIHMQLEKLCVDVARAYFNSSEMQDVTIECNLLTNFSDKTFHIEPNTEGYEYENLSKYDETDIQIQSRKVKNTLALGYAYNLYFTLGNLFLKQINELDSDLPRLYNKILKINNYLCYISDEEISDNNSLSGGFVEVNIGEQNGNTVSANGIIFPFLLIETLRGFIELISDKNLPDNQTDAENILDKSDILKDEPWYMILGIQLWQELAKHDNIVDVNFIEELFSLDEDKFLSVMSEYIAGTKEGRETIDGLVQQAKYKFDYSQFEKDLEKKRQEDNLLVDDVDRVLLENVMDEALYPQSFNMDEFKKITSFSGRVQYCKQHLKYLGKGSSRIVFQIDNYTVLKLAFNQKGVTQNEADASVKNDYILSGYDFLPEVYDVDENYLWIEMQIARKAKSSDFKKLTGYDFKTFCYYVQYCWNFSVAIHQYEKREIPDAYKTLFQSDEWVENYECSLFSEIEDYIGNYCVQGYGDLQRIVNWGVTQDNDGKEKLVLIDNGLNNDTIENYYR